MNDKEIVEGLEAIENSEIEAAKQFNKKMNKSINKKIYKKNIKVILILIVVAIIAYFGSSFVLNIANYNPQKEVIQLQNGEEISSYHQLMATYINTFYPGVDYLSYDSSDKQNGFSSYSMFGQFVNRFNQISVGENVVEVKMKYSTITNPEVMPIRIANQFFDVENNPDSVAPAETKEELIKELKTMPTSAQVDMTLSFQNKMMVEDFIQFKKEFKDTTFIYMTTHIRDSILFLGMSPYMTYRTDFNKQFNQTYPNLQAIEKETKEAYEQHYISNLQFLLDHKDFIRTVIAPRVTSGQLIPLMEKEIEKVKKEGLTFYAVRVYASRDDALKLLEKDNVYCATIMDASFSKYEMK